MPAQPTHWAICAAMRVLNPSLQWFVASANFVLQSECANHHDVLNRAVGSQWHLASRSSEFDQVVDAVTAGAITCHACPLKQADVIVDNVGGIRMTPRDKALLAMLLWFQPSTLWFLHPPKNIPQPLRILTLCP